MCITFLRIILAFSNASLLQCHTYVQTPDSVQRAREWLHIQEAHRRSVEQIQQEAHEQMLHLTTQHHLQSEYTCPPLLLSIIAPCLCADVEKDEQISKLWAAVRARSSQCDHLTAQLDEYGHHMGGGVRGHQLYGG